MLHPIVSCAQILHKSRNFRMSEIPKKLQSYSESLRYPVYDSWLHFYEEDFRCDVYTEGLTPCLEHIKKFGGALTLDRSIGWCDNLEVQMDADKVNRHSRDIFAQNGIPYIINVRFGDEKSYPFCFRDIPKDSILFVGALGTQARADHKTIFYSGVCTMIETLEPRALLIYGSVDKRIFELCIARDITLVRYPSQKEVIR